MDRGGTGSAETAQSPDSRRIEYAGRTLEGVWTMLEVDIATKVSRRLAHALHTADWIRALSGLVSDGRGVVFERAIPEAFVCGPWPQGDCGHPHFLHRVD
jgi:hypothetical protein